MWPQDDDEFEGAATTLIPRAGTRITAGVLAIARQKLSQQILAGDTAQHGSFRFTHEGIYFRCLWRQEPYGGYKLIFQGGGCSDSRAYLLVINPFVGTEFNAYYNDGVVQTIPGDRTKTDPDNSYKLARPGGYTPGGPLSGSVFSGQMREAVQCSISRGGKTPFLPFWTRTHGIVEYPRPRVIGGTVGEEAINRAQRRFWIVEISADGVYAAATRNTRRCCDSWAPPGSAVQSGSLNLAADFSGNPNTRVQQLMTAAALGNLYTAHSPFGASFFNNQVWGWAFSYSGHEAQHVVYKIAGGALFVARSKFSFTFTIVDNAPVIGASLSFVEGPTATRIPPVRYLRKLSNDGNTFLFRNYGTVDSDTVIAIANPLTVVPSDTTEIDVPVWVFYDGDTERVVRWNNKRLLTDVAFSNPFFTACAGGFNQANCTFGCDGGGSTDVTPGTVGIDHEEGINRLYISGYTQVGEVYSSTVTTNPNNFSVVLATQCDSGCGTGIKFEVHEVVAALNTTYEGNGKPDVRLTIPFYDREAIVMEGARFAQSGLTLGPENVVAVISLNSPPLGGCVEFPVPSAPASGSVENTTFRKYVLVGRSLLLDSGEDSVVGSQPFLFPDFPTYKNIEFFMGGGLFYDDPSLSPPTQKTNAVYLPVDVPGSRFGPTVPDVDGWFPLYTVTVGGFKKPTIFPSTFIGRI